MPVVIDLDGWDGRSRLTDGEGVVVGSGELASGFNAVGVAWVVAGDHVIIIVEISAELFVL